MYYFSLEDFSAPTGATVMARLRAPDASQSWYFTAEEGSTGNFSVPQTLLDPQPVELVDQYLWETRVTEGTQPSDFESSTRTLQTGEYGVAQDGAWRDAYDSDDAPTDHYGTRQDLEDRVGRKLVLKMADRDEDGVGVVSALEAAMRDADAKVDAALTAHGIALPIDEEDYPPTLVTAWSWLALLALMGGPLGDSSVDKEQARQITANAEWAATEIASYRVASTANSSTPSFPHVVRASDGCGYRRPDVHVPRWS